MAEAVVDAAIITLSHQSCRNYQVRLEVFLAQMVQKRRPAFGRIAQAPDFDGFICETAFVEVIKSLFTCGIGEHLLTEESGSFLKNGAQILPRLFIGFSFRGMLSEGDTSAFSKLL